MVGRHSGCSNVEKECREEEEPEVELLVKRFFSAMNDEDQSLLGGGLVHAVCQVCGLS